MHEGCPEGESAVYKLVQCTPLLVEKAGVAPDMTFRFTTPSKSVCRHENHSGFKTREEGHMKSKTGAISGPSNGPWSNKNIFKKETKKLPVHLNAKTPICTFGVLFSANEMVDGKCVGITQVGSYYIVYAGMSFTLFYALPSVILIILYGMVIFTLQKRLSNRTLATSEAFEKASVKVRLRFFDSLLRTKGYDQCSSHTSHQF